MAAPATTSSLLVPALAVAATLLLHGAGSPAAAAEVRKVLGFDGNAGQIVIPAQTSPNLLTPPECRTPFYEAGAGEVAVVSVTVTTSPSLPSAASLHLAVTRSAAFSPLTSVNVAAQVESMEDGTAMVSARARVPLTEGKTYQFGAGMVADEQTAASVLACQGTMIVYAEEP